VIKSRGARRRTPLLSVRLDRHHYPEPALALSTSTWYNSFINERMFKFAAKEVRRPRKFENEFEKKWVEIKRSPSEVPELIKRIKTHRGPARTKRLDATACATDWPTPRGKIDIIFHGESFTSKITLCRVQWDVAGNRPVATFYSTLLNSVACLPSASPPDPVSTLSQRLINLASSGAVTCHASF